MILLGITIDNKLVFKKHIENFCRAAQYKLHALTRIRKHLTLDKEILLGNTLINSQFNYAPLIWMFCRKRYIIKLNIIKLKISYWEVVQFSFCTSKTSTFFSKRNLQKYDGNKS